MPELPLELYREILRHVTPETDLRTLCITSKMLQAEAEFFMYQSIESNTLKHTEHICRMIISTPRVCPFVRHLHITKTSDAPINYWQLIAQALDALPSLTSLRISDLTKAVNNNSWILNHCTSALQELHCDFMMDRNLVAFLESQRGLVELKWVGDRFSSDGVDPPVSDLFPGLQRLITDSSVLALQMAHGHALTHVAIHMPCASDEEGWTSYLDEFGRTASHLRSLRLHFPYDKRTLTSALLKLASHAPEVRSLGFLPYFNVNDGDVITALANFKKLKSLATWSVIAADTARALAEACPSLRLVACLHYSYSHEYVFLPVNPPGVPHAMHDPDSRLWREA